MSKILNIFKADELNKLINSGDSVLLDFYAEWCNPCKMLSGRLEELSFKYPDVMFVKVDFDKSREIADSYSIKHMPTVIGFNQKKKLDEIVGFDDAKITYLADKLASLSSKKDFNSDESSMLPSDKTAQEPRKSVSTNEFMRGENLNYIYLTAKISDFPKFEKVKITVETRDQGWTSVPGSNSFFDLRIADANGNLLAEKTRIIENFGEENYKMKSFVLEEGDEVLGKYLKGDNILELVVRSQYAGWETFVKYAEIKFE